MKLAAKERLMRLAIAAARQGMRRGHGGPFGACIVQGNKVLAVAHNTVLRTRDATCHAEINAIRLASKKLGRHLLDGTVLYSTTEPCPMCFAAIHWARIDKVIYGASIAAVKRRGFNELLISNQLLKKRGRSPVRIQKDFMIEECCELLREWDRMPGKRTY